MLHNGVTELHMVKGLGSEIVKGEELPQLERVREDNL